MHVTKDSIWQIILRWIHMKTLASRLESMHVVNEWLHPTCPRVCGSASSYNYILGDYIGVQCVGSFQ